MEVVMVVLMVEEQLVWVGLGVTGQCNRWELCLCWMDEE